MIHKKTYKKRFSTFSYELVQAKKFCAGILQGRLGLKFRGGGKSLKDALPIEEMRWFVLHVMVAAESGHVRSQR